MSADFSLSRPQSGPQKGGSLIEVMVAVLVVSVGFIGMAVLQLQTLRNAQSSVQRTQAAALAYSIFETMRAAIDVNAIATPDTVLAGFNIAKTCIRQNGTALTPSQRWINSIKDTIGADASTCGQIACSGRTCTVSIFWNDERASGDRTALRDFAYVARATF